MPKNALKIKPIASAPDKGEFLARDSYGNFIVVERYHAPAVMGQNLVINRWTGKWWRAEYWAEIPDLK
ncbi:MAG: hypothetical protein CMI13_11830 [Oleibacter sp.]|nr:hypothetical protein [Thalassolituus sp.]|tara:strand:+ start:611 stop:814 length:204 start_codon:yes stop_codon:yes gene_type:complete